MEIKNLIEKAIQGGWKDGKDYNKTLKLLKEIAPISAEEIMLRCAVLDPKFWQAVGKTEKSFYEYTDNMYHMVSFLIKGGNLEDYIKTL